jgi:hypothetical protein
MRGELDLGSSSNVGSDRSRGESNEGSGPEESREDAIDDDCAGGGGGNAGRAGEGRMRRVGESVTRASSSSDASGASAAAPGSGSTAASSFLGVPKMTVRAADEEGGPLSDMAHPYHDVARRHLWLASMNRSGKTRP